MSRRRQEFCRILNGALGIAFVVALFLVAINNDGNSLYPEPGIHATAGGR